MLSKVKTIVLSAAVVLCLFSVNAFSAQNMPVDLPETEAIQKILSVTNSKLSEIVDIGDVYEIVTEQNGRKNIFYLTKDKKYIISGAVFDLSFRNITKDRLSELNKVDFSKLPLDAAITIQKGNGNKKLAMVTDVDCPFCRKAHEWLKTQDNYTLYVFLVPIDQLHPNARGKSIQILCSSDKQKALDDVEKGKTIMPEKCKQGEEMLAKHTLVGQILGVNGTPLFITEKGRKIEGFNQPALNNYITEEEK